MREPPRILVIDDDESNLDIAESQGYEVATAVDGDNALTRVRGGRPDLLIKAAAAVPNVAFWHEAAVGKRSANFRS